MRDRETALRIYETTDYDKFKLIAENRTVINNLELESAILNNNKLKYNPLIVNSDYEVIDGQHRLSIAKKHELPVYYLIDMESQTKDIRDLNTSNRNWTILDHVEYHAKRGNEHYQCVLSCYNKFKNYVAISTIIENLCNLKDKSVGSSVREGKLITKYSKDEIIDFLEKYRDIQLAFIKLSRIKRFSKVMQRALLTLISNPEYDHKRMLHVIDLYPDALITASRFNEIDNVRNAIVNGLYNKGAKTNRIEL